MLIHNVYFWLKDALTEKDLAAFERGLDTLCTHPPVKLGAYGKPASSEGDVVDGSYSYGLHVVFDDEAGHDAYQVGEIHQHFLAEHRAKWTRVLVYDTVTVD